jgi:hypothetical protein
MAMRSAGGFWYSPFADRLPPMPLERELHRGACCYIGGMSRALHPNSPTGGKIMRQLLLVSTTILGLAALPVLAQETAPAQQPAPAAGGDAAAAGASAPTPVPEQSENQVRTQSLVGTDVTNGQDTIGKVSDLVVTEDGKVDAIVVGIGGFLGIGQKKVALDWDSVKLTQQDDDWVFVVQATREQLEAMPEFKTLEDKQAEAAAAATQQQMQQAPATAPGAVPGAAPGTAAPGTAMPTAPATGNQ